MKKVLLALTIVTLMITGIALAEGGAEHNPQGDRVINTHAPEGTVSPDTTSQAIETQQRNWDKIEEKTGREITYSYKYVCDSGGSCMPVDPPRFQR